MNWTSLQQRWVFAAILLVASPSGYLASSWLSPGALQPREVPAVERSEIPSSLLEPEQAKVRELQAAGTEQMHEIFRRLIAAEDDDSPQEMRGESDIRHDRSTTS